VAKEAPTDHKVCSNIAKKDQLRVIAPVKRKYILKVALKIVLIATSYILLEFSFIVLTLTVPALLQSKI